MKKSRYILFVVFLFAAGLSGICAGATITVGPNGDYDFTSIQAAITSAVHGDKIVVAPGTYNEAINFNGKAVRLVSSGGPEVTTIDGTGHYHVVQCVTSEGPDSILEGFTIRGGAAGTGAGGGIRIRNSSPTIINCIVTQNSARNGGGVYVENGSPTLSDCVLQGNTVTNVGGGIYSTASSPTLTRCIVTGNTAANHGGGVHNHNSNSTIIDCTIEGNTANKDGGGMYNDGAAPTITNCIFISNSANYGGAMYNVFGTAPLVVNCIFRNNTASFHGGGLLNQANAVPTLINCTFYGNTASSGGAMSNHGYGGASVATVVNCILWASTGGAIRNFGGSAVVNYSNVQGGYSGTENIDADPLFVDVAAGNLRLSFGSPCIDAGDNAAVPAGTVTDLEGNNRIMDGTQDGLPVVDMGAYEFDVTVFPFNVTQDQFYPTIQAAIDDADHGDEIVVSPGTYYEAINFLGKAVHLYSSDGPEVTIIDGSKPTVLLREDFNDGNYDGWTIVDQGTHHGPSIWVVEGGQLAQKSNIHGTPLSDPKMLGTFALWDDAAAMEWTDYAMTVTMRSTDDDAMGVMFRYQDEHNYYRFAWLNQNHNQGVGRRQLSRMQDGEVTVMAHNDVPYTVHQSYEVRIVTSGTSLQVLIDGEAVLTADDSAFADGSVALFCWGNQSTYFDNVEVVLPIYHVVQCISGEGTDTILEGFTLTGGNADGPADTDKRGGGMYNYQSSPTVQNCTFSHNTAHDGGGMYNFASRPTVTHSSFLNNTANGTGGGMYSRDQSHLTITHSTFSGNYAGGGGGAMVNTIYTHPKMTNCVFIENTTPSRGGAIYNYFHSNPTITHCTFSRNTADDGGGGIYNNLNCTPTVANSILWGNSPNQFLNIDGSNPTVTYSTIQGESLWPGEGNINADPLFVDAPAGNLRIRRGSPCIDAGNNDAVPTGITTDLNGWSRFIDDPCTTDTGSGTGPIADMGAYEFMPADIDYSGTVNFADISIVAAHWQQSGGGDLAGADLNCDGVVDLADLAILAENWLVGGL